MSTTADKLVDRYLKHLEIELDDLPRDRRREIVDEIAGHIDEARAATPHESETTVRNILDGLGEPSEIAAEARERLDVAEPPPAPPRRTGGLEIAALVLLLVGGAVVPVFGWVIGVVLLWLSSAWTVGDKIIGTLVVPGGLMTPLALFFMVGWSTSSVCDGSGTATSCVSHGGQNFALLALFVTLALAPIATTIYLGYRLRRSPASSGTRLDGQRSLTAHS